MGSIVVSGDLFFPPVINPHELLKKVNIFSFFTPPLLLFSPLLSSFLFFFHSLFFVSNLFPNSGLRGGSQGQCVAVQAALVFPPNFPILHFYCVFFAFYFSILKIARLPTRHSWLLSNIKLSSLSKAWIIYSRRPGTLNYSTKIAKWSIQLTAEYK